MNDLNEDVVQVQSCYKESGETTDIRSNVVIAAFVTSYARMELYEAMDFMGLERLLYVDTDCVFALEGSQWPSLPEGNCLGEFKSKIGTSKILLFVCEGAKLYVYRTNDGVQVYKAKGISINLSNINVFQPEVLQAVVNDPSILHKILNLYKIFRMKGSWELASHPQEKLFRFTFDKRALPQITVFYLLATKTCERRNCKDR